MPATDGVNFNIPRPKRETRGGPKKRFTFDGKEFTPTSQQKEGQQQPAEQQQLQQKQRKSDNKSDNKEEKKSKATKGKGKPGDQQALAPLDDDAENQGFAEWLRSGDGVDMMRLFVIANSLLVFVTMAWPHMQESFSILREFIFGGDGDE